MALVGTVLTMATELATGASEAEYNDFRFQIVSFKASN